MQTVNTPGKNRRGRCPLCGQPASPDHAPFCGQGCRDRDLLQWLGDGYRIPGPPADPENADKLLDKTRD